MKIDPRFRLLCRTLAALTLVGGFVLSDFWRFSAAQLGPSAAWADDDDDDGGGGNYGSSGASGDSAAPAGQGTGLPRFLRSLENRLRPGRQRQPQRAQAAPTRVNDEIIASGLDAPQLDQLVSLGFEIRGRQTLASLGGEIVRLVPANGQNLETARDAVRQIAPAAAVDFNHFYDPSEARPCGGAPCVAPDLVGWPAAQLAANSCVMPDATVGLIDTAINSEHETFRASRIEVHRLDTTSAKTSGEQHGTAVASLLVGTGPSGTPGLLPGARLVAVDAFEASNRAEAFDLIRAIDLLIASEAGVINMSISGPENALLAKAVDQVSSRGIAIVAAAGNDGPGGKPAYPAAYEQVIAVTAVDRRKRVYRRANRGDYIDLAAPGVEVWVAASIKGTRTRTGTSFAAPFVTAAVILARANQTAAGDVLEQLMQQAEDLGDPGKDPVFGAGLLNVSGLCR